MNSSLDLDGLKSRDFLWPSLLDLLQSSEQEHIGRDEDHIHKRDICTQAFGAGWTQSTCSPGSTLCCLNQNSNFPQCEQYFGAGWCCVAYQQTCYIDLTDTSCDAAGSVPCTELAPGTKSACCLEHTTCASGYNASSTYARCNIQQLALQSLASSSTSSTTSTNSRTTTRTTKSSTTSLTSTDLAATSSKSTAIGPAGVTVSASATSSPTLDSSQGGGGNSNSAALSGGAIAGIVIGVVVAVLLGILIALLLWRRRSRKHRFEAAGPVAQYQDLQPQPGQGVATTYYAPTDHQNGTQEKAAELAAPLVEPGELPAENAKHIEPAELEDTQRR